MICPYNNEVNCYRINGTHWITGKLPCDKCDIGVLARQFGKKEK